MLPTITTVPLRKRGLKPTEGSTLARDRDNGLRAVIDASFKRATTDTLWFCASVRNHQKTLHTASRVAKAGACVFVPERARFQKVNGHTKGKREYTDRPLQPYILIGVTDLDQLRDIICRFHGEVTVWLSRGRTTGITSLRVRDLDRWVHAFGCGRFEPGRKVKRAKYWQGIEAAPEVIITDGWMEGLRGRVQFIKGREARVVGLAFGLTSTATLPLDSLRRVGETA